MHWQIFAREMVLLVLYCFNS